MGRKVFVTSEMSVDEHIIEVAESDPQAALLWPWILTAFDDWGRSNADPKRLKASVFPAVETVTAEVIESALRLYAEVGLILLYEHEGKRYMAVPSEKWFKYQTHIRSEKRSKDNSHYPAPPCESDTDCEQMRAGARNGAQVREGERNYTPSPSPSPSAATAVPRVVSTTASDSVESVSNKAAAVDEDKTTDRDGQVPSQVEPLGPRQVLNHVAKKLATLPVQISARDASDIREDCARHGPEVVMRAVDLGYDAQMQKGKYKRGDPRLGPDIHSYQFFREFLNQAKELVEEEQVSQKDREIGERRRAETKALIAELMAAGGG